MSIRVHRIPQIICPTFGSTIRPTIGFDEQLMADFVFYIGFLCVCCSCDCFLYISLCVGVCGQLCRRGALNDTKVKPLLQDLSHARHAQMHGRSCRHAHAKLSFNHLQQECPQLHRCHFVQYVLLFCIAK